MVQRGDACQWGENLQKILVDRFKDVIKTGGENVSSIRVEAVMMQHPAIDKAAVIGVQDARWGEAVTGMAVLRSNQTVTEKDLIAFLQNPFGSVRGSEKSRISRCLA